MITKLRLTKMVTIPWLVSLAVQIWSHIYSEAATCMAKFDFQLMCPQYSNGTPLITGNNTGSVIACSYLCSSDLNCRSFQYNPNNKKCRTNAERLTTSNTSCSHRILYGEIQKATCRRYWLFGPCLNDSDCIIANSSCIHGQCECGFGHPYDYRTDSCPAGCTKYGNTLHEVSYYLKGLNNDDIWYIDLTECQTRCFAATTFVCRHIEYNDNAQRTCHLSEFNFITAPAHKVKFESLSRLRQWDRNCD